MNRYTFSTTSLSVLVLFRYIHLFVKGCMGGVCQRLRLDLEPFLRKVTNIQWRDNCKQMSEPYLHVVKRVTGKRANKSFLGGLCEQVSDFGCNKTVNLRLFRGLSVLGIALGGNLSQSLM